MTGYLYHHPLRPILMLLFAALAVLLSAPVQVEARGAHPRHSQPVSLHISAGYGGVYRDTTWTPIRVTLRNTTATDIQGTLELPQNSEAPSIGASPTYHGLYDVPVVLPAGETKHVTVYVPGAGVQGEVNARFLSRGKAVAVGGASVIGVDSSTLLIGVMTDTPGSGAWVGPAIQKRVTTRIVALSPPTFDPIPDSLAAFNVIVLTAMDTSQLDGAQRGALQSYVREGGSLLLIGGPSARSTLDSLPAGLLPGHLAGTRVLPDLRGLGALGAVSRSSRGQTALVSVLSDPRGSVLASQSGVPLVVRVSEGQGVIEYTAFDPAQGPELNRGGRLNPLTHILASATPGAIGRTLSPQGFQARIVQAASSAAVTAELANLSDTRFPLQGIFAVLTLLYVLILGPVNVLVLHRLRRERLSWITVPALAVSFTVLVFVLGGHLRGSSTVINTVGLITLDGRSGQHPATLYVGLVAPLSGDYQLTYGAPALPGTITQLNQRGQSSIRDAAILNNGPLGVRLQEGAQTHVTFLRMKQWSTRDILLKTTVNIPGAVHTDLVLNEQGTLAGVIRNDTNLDILHPVIVSGQTVAALPNIPAGASVRAEIHPDSSPYAGQSSIWATLFDRNSPGDGGGFGGFRGFGGFGDCCDQSSLPAETTLAARERNAVTMLSQADALSSPGEVVLAGWSVRPLGSVAVDGSTPQQRALTLIAMPIPVHFPSHGTFRLPTGTIGASLIDINPQPSGSDCCNFFSVAEHQISIGAGGSVTFEFDMPHASRVRFRRLQITTNSDDSGISQGDVYNWRSQRWVRIDLSGGSAPIPHADRFVSRTGTIWLRLRATTGAGDMTMDNPSEDVQISGTGQVT